MPNKFCTTQTEVIEELGGGSAVATLVERAPSTITWWLHAGKFPPRYYFVMIKALKTRGSDAPHSLWGFAQSAADVA